MLHMLFPLAAIIRTVRVIERPCALPPPGDELPFVPVVELLLLLVEGRGLPRRRVVPRPCGVRAREGDVGRVPRVGPPPVRLVLAPRAGVLLGGAAGPPHHRALAAHLPRLPLALVRIPSWPHLLSLPVLLPRVPLPVVERRAVRLVHQPAVAGPLPAAPLAVVTRQAVRGDVQTMAMPFAILELALVLRTVRPEVLPLPVDAAGHEGSLV
mmetsp:Transcript_22133/g.66159  ORF Transcript_22133/g.66159 Transcript_22133/m.66159 type:complete len:211 (-) Transcript_22133:263-895(-)